MIVGPTKYTFKIHKGLVCRYSAFFRAALTDGFPEATAFSVSLPAQDPEIFKSFVRWLYTGDIVNRANHADCEWNRISAQRSNSLEKEYAEHNLPKASQPGDLPFSNEIRKLYELDNYRAAPFDKLVDLYLLADYFQVSIIRDLIITKLIMVYGDISPPEKRRKPCVRF